MIESLMSAYKSILSAEDASRLILSPNILMTQYGFNFNEFVMILCGLCSNNPSRGAATLDVSDLIEAVAADYMDGALNVVVAFDEDLRSFMQPSVHIADTSSEFEISLWGEEFVHVSSVWYARTKHVHLNNAMLCFVVNI